MEIRHLGIVPYREAWEMQLERFREMVARSHDGLPQLPGLLITLQHTPTITLGRHANRANILLDAETLRRRGYEVVEIERGGDVTYHGPGQLVVYPILDMKRYGLGIKAYIHLLEEAVIRTIADYGVKGERVEGATGVWIEKGTPRERKICAIGVKCSRYITMHGLALNVNTDLDAFRVINPCGFTDKGVCSLATETGRETPMEEVAQRLTAHLLTLLNEPKP